MDTILQTQDLAIGYRNRSQQNILAQHLNLNLHRGELVCLLGLNGIGKTTLVRTLAGMLPPLNGQIVVCGSPITSYTALQLARRVAVVTTERINVGILDAYTLVSLGRFPYTDWQGHLTSADHRIIHWALQTADAEQFSSRNVSELSDGERQKVMIARALAQEPDLLLLDEPTAFLDLPHRIEMMRILQHLADHMERAVLVTTHDLDLALHTADRLWIMAPDGSMHDGSPEDLVLQEVFARSFANHGVQFEPETGGFKLIRQTAGLVNLHPGTGLAAIWTQRALERAGYQLTQSTAPIHIQIDLSEAAPTWRVQTTHGTHAVKTIYALISFLKQYSISQ
jgi:iron complex transport system ATP-binding protein